MLNPFEHIDLRLDRIEQLVRGISEQQATEANTPPPAENLPDLVKIEEAANITGFKQGYLYELVNKNTIPFHRVGRSLRFSRRELEAWIKSGRPQMLAQAASNMVADILVNGGPKKKKG